MRGQGSCTLPQSKDEYNDKRMNLFMYSLCNLHSRFHTSFWLFSSSDVDTLFLGKKHAKYLTHTVHINRSIPLNTHLLINITMATIRITDVTTTARTTPTVSTFTSGVFPLFKGQRKRKWSTTVPRPVI